MQSDSSEDRWPDSFFRTSCSKKKSLSVFYVGWIESGLSVAWFTLSEWIDVSSLFSHPSISKKKHCALAGLQSNIFINKIDWVPEIPSDNNYFHRLILGAHRVLSPQFICVLGTLTLSLTRQNFHIRKTINSSTSIFVMLDRPFTVHTIW